MLTKVCIFVTNQIYLLIAQHKVYLPIFLSKNMNQSRFDELQQKLKSMEQECHDLREILVQQPLFTYTDWFLIVLGVLTCFLYFLFTTFGLLCVGILCFVVCMFRVFINTSEPHPALKAFDEKLQRLQAEIKAYNENQQNELPSE